MSSVLEVSRPTVEPVSAAEAVAFLKQPPDVADLSLIMRTLVPSARRYVEGATGLILANRDFVQYEDGFPSFPSGQTPYGSLFGAAFPLFFYGYSASYPYPGIGGLQNKMAPFVKTLKRSPVTAVKRILYVTNEGKLRGLLPGTDFVVDYAGNPGRISPLPGSRWPMGIYGTDTVQVFYSAGFTSGSDDTEDISLGAEWQPLFDCAQWAYFIDGNGNVEACVAGGTTGKIEPAWGAVASQVADGSATWLNAGPVLGAYQTGHAYSAPCVVVDSNGNLELAQEGFTSGGAAPTWNTAPGASTPDNGGAWVNIGAQRQQGPEPPNQPVEYQGDTAIPDDLKMAVLLMVSHYYYNRDPVAAGAAAVVPLSVQSICDNNRVYGFEPIVP